MDMDQFFNERRYSPISDEFPCKIKYPKFYEAHKTEITLCPGEMVFIPAGWFHLVFSDVFEDGVNFAMNHWYHVVDEGRMEEGESSDLKPFKSTHDLDFYPDKVMRDDGEIRVMISPNGKFGSTSVEPSKFEEGLDVRTWTWREFWSQKRKDSYLVQHENMDLKEYEPGRDHWAASTMWVCFAKLSTYLHYDRQDNFLMQIKGTKKIHLFPPEDHQLLYTFNPYPLSTIQILMNCWGNWNYVQIYHDSPIKGFLDKFTSISGEVDHPDLKREYISYIGRYTEKVMEIQGWMPTWSSNSEPKFMVTKSEFIGNFTFFHPHIHCIFFLTDSCIRVSRSEYFITAGSVVCFPNIYIYNWCVKPDTIVILAVARESTEQGSV
jgi:hypothetical protein